MRVVEVLTAARELVARPGGWCQGEYQRDEAFCAIGAIRFARTGQIYPTLKTQPAEAALCTATHSFQTVQPWNDAKGRTQAEVVAAFDRAIAATDARPVGSGK